MVLKLHGNPLCTADESSRFAYRKEYVLQCGDLEELDKLKVLPAERLKYQGHLPRLNIYKQLEDLEIKTQQEEAAERLDIELQQ